MKYLLLKHYRGGPAPIIDLPPMDRWTPEEVDAHIGFMRDFAARLERTGEYVDGQALAPDGAFVPRYDGEGRAQHRRAVRRDSGTYADSCGLRKVALLGFSKISTTSV